MRILAIVPSVYDTNPSQRYRIEQWEPLLRGRGVEVTYKPFEAEALHEGLDKQGDLRREVGGRGGGARAPRGRRAGRARVRRGLRSERGRAARPRLLRALARVRGRA